MSRMTIDCRTMPSEANCTMTLSGEPDDLLRAAVAHAVDAHGHTDDDELRDALRGAMTPAAGLDLGEGAFVQLIEFRAPNLDGFDEAAAEWLAEIGDARTATWSVVTADRDDPGRYVQLVAFPDYEAAMRNSKHPATGRIAERMRERVEGEQTFRNLDVQRVGF
jgi:hypothetical protein